MNQEKYLSLFYNETTLQDVLIAKVSNPDKLSVIHTENKGDVVIFYGEANCLLGFNILQASQKELFLKNGLNRPTSELISKLEKLTGLDLSAYCDKVPFYIGEIKTATPIPNSHLNYCEVNINAPELLKIVCGGTNVRPNLKVVVVVPGGMVINGLEIAPSKVLGHQSAGMLCSAKELGLKQTTPDRTILELPDTEIVGKNFYDLYR